MRSRMCARHVRVTVGQLVLGAVAIFLMFLAVVVLTGTEVHSGDMLAQLPLQQENDCFVMEQSLAGLPDVFAKEVQIAQLRTPLSARTVPTVPKESPAPSSVPQAPVFGPAPFDGMAMSTDSQALRDYVTVVQEIQDTCPRTPAAADPARWKDLHLSQVTPMQVAAFREEVATVQQIIPGS